MACSCFEIWVVLTILTSYSPVYRPCDCDYIGKTAGHPDAPTLYLVSGGTWSRIHVMLVGHQLICVAGRKESLYAITVCMFLRNTRKCIWQGVLTYLLHVDGALSCLHLHWRCYDLTLSTLCTECSSKLDQVNSSVRLHQFYSITKMRRQSV